MIKKIKHDYRKKERKKQRKIEVFKRKAKINLKVIIKKFESHNFIILVSDYR